MLKLFLKSAFYYTLINKYGKKIGIILLNVFFIIFIQFVYSDIIEILTLNELQDYSLYALLGKWILILLSFTFIAITIKNIISKSTNKDDKEFQKVSNNSNSIDKANCKFEEQIIKKDKLKKHSDLIMEELLSKKDI